MPQRPISRLRRIVFGEEADDSFIGPRSDNNYTTRTPGASNKYAGVSRTPLSMPTKVIGNPVVSPPSGGGTSTNEFDWKKGVSSLAPFVSNIVNSFRKPPQPKAPRMDSPVSLQRVNMNNDRRMVEDGIRTSTGNAFRTLDENSANAVGLYNVAQRANQLSGVNQAERNQNIQISNQETMTNAGISARNNQKLDNFDEQGIDRGIAIQREQSENLSNAADKYVAISNEQQKANLEKKRLGVISAMYNRNGVSSRVLKRIGEVTGKDALGIGGDDTELQEALAQEAEERKKRDMATMGTYRKFGGSLKYSAGNMLKKIN